MQLIYNSKTREFITKDPAILDPRDWRASFRKFIINEMKSNSYIELSTDLFSKQEPVVPVIGFYDRSTLQIWLLRKLKYNKKYLDYVAKLHQVDVEGLIKYVNNWYGETMAKLHELKYEVRPAGYEQLDDFRYGGKISYSIESYDANRIIYQPNLPYRIKVFSVLLHYNDEPRDKYLRCLSMVYQELIESGEVSQKAAFDATYAFGKDCSKYSAKIEKENLLKRTHK